MARITLAVLLLCLSGWAQITIPDGTKIRVQLDQTISSATAEEGQTVELIATDAVKIGDVVAFPEGCRATGTVTVAREKRRMGRAGKLDFSIDRIKAADNRWIPVRYTTTRKSGESHAVRTGVLTAGAVVVFWPAAPVLLLMKGKDVTVNKGVAFEVYTDGNHVLNAPLPPADIPSTGAVTPAPTSAPGGTATLSVTCPVAGADIEVDGAFVGNTPTTLQLSGGAHRVVVSSGARKWERTVQVNPGSTISLNATFR